MTKTRANIDVALDLARNGFNVFPCHAGGDKAKAPLNPPIMSWRKQSTCETANVQRWWSSHPRAAIGLDLGKSRFIVIDCDRHGDDDGVENFGQMVKDHGHDWDFDVIVATPNQGTHIFFRMPDGQTHGNGRGALPDGVDVRGDGGYVIAPGTTMQDGRIYDVFGDIANAPICPQWLWDILKSEKPKQQPDGNIAPHSAATTPVGNDELSDLLDYISPDLHHDEWVAVLMAIHAETGGSSDGRAMADAWSSRGLKYKGRKEIEVKWRSFKRTGIKSGTIGEYARRGGADLSAIAIKHRGTSEHLGDAQHGAHIARILMQSKDGTLHDAQTGEIIETTDATCKDDLQVEFPNGLVGDIAQWIVATSRSPQPELSIAAALTLVGVSAGRHIAGPTQAGTALYALCLSPTGSGKDHPLKQISRVMTASKMGHHIGPPEFISMTAVVNTLKRKPLCLCPMDEFGDFMRRVYAKKGSPHERAIPKIMRTMWSANFDQAATPEWAGLQSEIIHAPHMSLFAVSTHEQFYTALEGGAATDGTLNRFLIIEGRKYVNEQDPIYDPHIVPAHISDGMRKIFNRSGEMAAALRNDPNANPADAGRLTTLDWCPDGAQKAWQDFRAQCKRKMIDDPHEAEFWVRGAEMSIRIATIVAAGCHRDNVRIEDIKFGIAMAQRSIEIMAEGASSYMAETDAEANIQKILRIVQERGLVKRRDLMRSMKSVRTRDLNDALAFMVEAEYIERVEVKPETGRPSVSYRAI